MTTATLPHIPSRPSGASPIVQRLRLLPCGDGWSLLTTDGRVVHRALGYRARRECLAFARDAGVLAIER